MEQWGPDARCLEDGGQETGKAERDVSGDPGEARLQQRLWTLPAGALVTRGELSQKVEFALTSVTGSSLGVFLRVI